MSKLKNLKTVLEKWKPDAVLLGALTKQYICDALDEMEKSHADALAEQYAKLRTAQVRYNDTLAERTKWQEVSAALQSEIDQIKNNLTKRAEEVDQIRINLIKCMSVRCDDDCECEVCAAMSVGR